MGPSYVSTTSATRQRHTSNTSAPRRRHAGSTQAPRRIHLSATDRGAPAVAGGDSGHPGTRGWARWTEETKGNNLVAAPLLFGRWSNGGEHFRGGRSSVRTDSTNPSANVCDLGMGKELSSPGTRGAGRGGKARRKSMANIHGGRRTEMKKTMKFRRSRPSQQARVSVEGKRRSAKRTAVSEWRGKASVNGGDKSQSS